ncbi:hypothetical protein JOM56_011806 [Amanita muscaria]
MELEKSMDGCDVYVDDCVSPDGNFELLEEVESDSGEDGKMDEGGVVINEDVKVDDEDVRLVMSVTVTETEVVKGMDGLGGLVNVGRPLETRLKTERSAYIWERGQCGSRQTVVNGGVVGEVMVGNDTGIDVAEDWGGKARDVDRDLGSGEFDIVVVVVPVVGDGVKVGFGLVTPFAGVVGFAGADDANGNAAVVVIGVTVVAVGVKVGGVEVTALPGTGIEVKMDDDTSDVDDPVKTETGTVMVTILGFWKFQRFRRIEMPWPPAIYRPQIGYKTPHVGQTLTPKTKNEHVPWLAVSVDTDVLVRKKVQNVFDETRNQ